MKYRFPAPAVWRAVAVFWGLSGFLLTQTGHAAPIDMTRRHVAASVSPGNVLSAGGQIRSLSTASATNLVVIAALDATQAKSSYGLLVPNATAASLTINGVELSQDPLPRQDGLVFNLFDNLLTEGKNEIEVHRTPTTPNATWEGLVMFSLDGTSEEVHFGASFNDSPELRAQPATHSSQAKYDVQWYDCYWQPSMSASSLTSATVWVGAKSLDSTLQQVALDFDPNGSTPAMVVARVDSGPGTATLPYTTSNTTKFLIVTLPAAVPAGQEFRIRVAYSGTPNTAGAFGQPYRRTTHSGTTVIYTFSEPYGARQWWPCKDQTSDKATTTVQRIKVPSGAGWQVVSNGALSSQVNNGDGTETWTWTNSYPIATYLLSVCVSNYSYSSATYTALDTVTTMPIKHAVYPENFGSENGAAGTLQVMNFFASKFGEYPFLTEKYYTASHNSSSGMEHQTCTSMPGSSIDGVGISDGMQRRNVHELAHHWFGDKITCTTFDHLWLNEGFATYCEALWFESTGGSSAYHSWVNGWSVSQTQAVAGPNSDNFSGSSVYRKGAWVLHMLRHVMGDVAFFQGVRNYITSPSLAYGNADSDTFRGYMEAAYGQSLSTYFNQWLYRYNPTVPSPQPTYKIVANTNSLPNTLTVNLSQTQSGTAFVMPLDVRAKDASNATQTYVVNNSLASETFNIPTGSFVPVEFDLDPDNWVLDSTDNLATAVTSPNRVSINTCGVPKGTRGTPYSRTMRASYGATSYTWSQPSGTLPPGLSLSSGGVLSGTPTVAGSFTFTIQVTDGAATTASTSITMVVDPPAQVDGWEVY
ncbi:MAG: putative Ig domain-containing protein [Candidatus Sumerlaeaceae bacterium]|nr:putative Ig domain-containing protein [Candidatus Sumerlaeaceae bacterium]